MSISFFVVVYDLLVCILYWQRMCNAVAHRRIRLHRRYIGARQCSTVVKERDSARQQRDARKKARQCATARDGARQEHMRCQYSISTKTT